MRKVVRALRGAGAAKNEAHHPAGRLTGARREEEIGSAARAGGRPLDRLRVNSGAGEAEAHGRRQIDMRPIVFPETPSLRIETLGDLGPDLEAARADSRPDLDLDSIGSRSGGDRGLDTGFEDPRQDPSPAGMNGADDSSLGVGEEDRQAIGDGDEECEVRSPGDQAISFACVYRRLDVNDSSSMHLMHTGHRPWIETRGVVEASAILPHRVRAIGGRAAEIQAIEGGGAHPARPHAEPTVDLGTTGEEAKERHSLGDRDLVTEVSPWRIAHPGLPFFPIA